MRKHGKLLDNSYNKGFGSEFAAMYEHKQAWVIPRKHGKLLNNPYNKGFGSEFAAMYEHKQA